MHRSIRTFPRGPPSAGSSLQQEAQKSLERRDAMSHTKALIRRLAAGALSVLLLTGLTGALAASVEEVVPDPDRTGSLTLYKYADAGTLDALFSLTPAEQAACLRNGPDGLEPLTGVSFLCLKVADLTQDSREGTVRLAYTPDPDFRSFCGLDGEEDPDIESLETLSLALVNKSLVQVQQFALTQGAAELPATDGCGKTQIRDLPLGLYLVAEYKYPAEIMTSGDYGAPFLVSVPSADPSGDGWNYDVTVIPKNQAGTVTNDKVLVGPDGSETKQADASIGDTVQYRIRSDVPAGIGQLESYRIVDTLSAGLTYDPGSALVYALTPEGQRIPLSEGPDTFAFAPEDQMLTWDFDPGSLGDAEGWAVYACLEITYTARLNGNAVIGEPGNGNSLQTQYSSTAHLEQSELVTITPDTEPVVYTYALQITKTDSKTGAPLAGAGFALLDAEGQQIPLSRSEDGTYRPDAAGTAALVTDSLGVFRIRGLGSGTYVLRETDPPAGYAAPEEDVQVCLTTSAYTYVPSAAGLCARADAVICGEGQIPLAFPDRTGPVSGDTLVWWGSALSDVSDSQRWAPEPLTWSGTSSQGTAEVQQQEGVLYLEISNTPKLRLPKTGTDGGRWLLPCGVCALALGGVLTGLALRKHRRSHSERR